MASFFREKKLHARPARRKDVHFSFAPLVTLAFIAGLATASCNIVQGFQDAGDTLFPEQKTYLAAPGVQLVNGGYSDLGFAVGTDIYLVARGTDDTTGGLFSMPYGDPKPCLIPAVGRFWATSNANRKVPLFAYFADNESQGLLQFADANCSRFDLQFDGARLPVAETDSSLVIWAGNDLWLATPELDLQQQLASDVQDFQRSALGYVVRTSSNLQLFDADWVPLGSFGDQVVYLRVVGSNLMFSDNAGVHRLSGTPQDLKDEVVAEDACELGMQDGTWATFRSPCSSGPVIALNVASDKQFELSFDADPQRLKLVPARGSAGADPTQDPFWFFGMRDGGTDDSQATLVVQPPTGSEFTLGAHATFQQLQLLQSAEETHGYALVDVDDNGSGNYLWWDAAGHTKQLAQHALSQPSRLIVDFDGSLGKLAVVSGDRLLVLAKGVPWPEFEYRDATREWTALFHDLNLPGQPHGQTGQLSVFYGSLDALQATPVGDPFTAPDLQLIAPSAAVFRVAALGQVLSGVMYLSDFDEQLGTGSLDYRNLDLRFTAHVADGVSDYAVVNDQVLYAVPRGENAGIWLVSGK